MYLSDTKIKGLIDDGVLTGADKESVGPVSCDLHTDEFVTSTDGVEEHGASCALKPGDSTFVKCVEGIRLPADLTATVLLKNSRIRQGLTLDAPLYFPGHGTPVYFRVTNVSADEITLNSGNPIAQIAFERVDGTVEKPYSGAFQDEVDFRGMSDYKGAYDGEARKLEKTAEDIKGVEHRIYGNVLAMMAIVAGVFTLVNVNTQAASSSVADMVSMNLSTVGAFSVMFALIGILMGDGRKASAKAMVCVGAVCFAASIALSLV